MPTLKDIVAEIVKPGRDIRDALPKPQLRKDIMDINDLMAGMELTGTVRNVVDFGVFVDIGVHQDGLVHISEITDKYQASFRGLKGRADGHRMGKGRGREKEPYRIDDETEKSGKQIKVSLTFAANFSTME